jgi:TolB protein
MCADRQFEHNDHAPPPRLALSLLTSALIPILIVCLTVVAAAGTAPPPVPGRIAFQSDRDGNWELYLMDPDGTGVARLTNHPAEDWLPRPALSPPGMGGRRLVFVSNRDGGWHIYRLDVDLALKGGVAATSRLTDSTQNNRDPAVSPDGRTLAFSALDGRQRDVYLLDLATGRTRNVTRHPADDWLPAWGPPGSTSECGRQLAFVSDRDGNFEIYRLDLGTGTLTNLTQHPADDWVPAWSPGGHHSAFQSDRNGNWEIYRLDLDTGEVRNLTRHPADDWDPAWGPVLAPWGGSQRILFMSLRDGNREIYVMDGEDGGTLQRLTDDPAADKNPV